MQVFFLSLNYFPRIRCICLHTLSFPLPTKVMHIILRPSRISSCPHITNLDSSARMAAPPTSQEERTRTSGNHSFLITFIGCDGCGSSSGIISPPSSVGVSSSFSSSVVVSKSGITGVATTSPPPGHASNG